MTIEEAIERYSHNAEYERADGNLQGCLEFNQLADWLKDYKRLLEQEPCEDCINRHSAKKIIFDEFEGWPTDEEVARLKRLTKQFDELPSVKQESEVGHWIPVTNGRGGHECSLCHNYAPSYQAGGEHLSRFCPECGAKMEDKE